MKRISQRAVSRCCPVLVALVLGVFVFTAVRLRHGSQIQWKSIIHAGLEHNQGLDKPSWVPGTASPPSDRPSLEPGTCSSEIESLRLPELSLSDNILYSRRCVRPVRGKVDRDAIANISRPLITSTTTVNLTSCIHADIEPCEPLTLHVPSPYPKIQYPHLIFGVATTYDRIRSSIPAFAHWLSGTGAQLVGTITDANEPNSDFNLTLLEESFRHAGVLATFKPPKLTKRISHEQDDARPVPVEHHHFMLIRELLALSTPSTRWLGILDDDTFFPALYPLDQELHRYDASKPFWLGALSDDFDSVKLWGFMAFGGAGVFLSMPLARMLEPHSETCIRDTTINTGDGILRDCVYAHSRTKLTIVPGLYQHDFRGDASGFYESGVRPLSVHHWKSWYKEPIPQMAAVTDVCGDCFLQRWRLGKDTMLANGYSITVYPGKEGTKTVDFGKIEGTWLHPGHEYDFSYGPLRKKLVEGEEKKTYKLREVRKGDGVFRQVYVYEGSKAVEGGMDEVVELVWEL
ncbi:hypothetical protein B0T19DRAFT_362292 [Cercophora scortea]|uniref:Glycosyltransferase family 31 protein n=1 Tax=Cercophora scortea TaxID=314031 RepID=A0AAE0M5F5_9PEZI|nr:hypothetical protein B0T19DRAFT_362292 [Cercophora scortea]